jgi:hypothetical protein
MKDEEEKKSTSGSSLILPPSALREDLLDPDALLAGCGADAGLLQTMCGHFRNFVPDRLAEVTEALRSRNTLRLRESAHKLGGMVSSFSAVAGESVARLGRLGGEGRFEEATHIHGQLTEMVAEVVSMLDTLSVDQLRRLASRRPRN